MTAHSDNFRHHKPSEVSEYKDETYWRAHQRGVEAARILLAKIMYDELVDLMLQSEAEKSGLRADVEHLSEMSKTDPLTGLQNRRGVEESYARFQLAASPDNKRSSEFRPQPSFVLHIDVDDFKEVNDTEGHNFGDEVLKTLAENIFTHTRTSSRQDIGGRLGGDEFVVLLTQAPQEKALEIANLIRTQTLEKTATTISVGVAEVDYRFSLADNLARADIALYEAKELGRNSVVLYSPELD